MQPWLNRRSVGMLQNGSIVCSNATHTNVQFRLENEKSSIARHAALHRVNRPTYIAWSLKECEERGDRASAMSSTVQFQVFPVLNFVSTFLALRPTDLFFCVRFANQVLLFRMSGTVNGVGLGVAQESESKSQQNTRLHLRTKYTLKDKTYLVHEHMRGK